ncbi:hypothetical protein TNCV_494211 [Trichonephila clavipes]|nr:hypothetical protein TNCV_494211 [Trichonephila clavipes]
MISRITLAIQIVVPVFLHGMCLEISYRLDVLRSSICAHIEIVHWKTPRMPSQAIFSRDFRLSKNVGSALWKLLTERNRGPSTCPRLLKVNNDNSGPSLETSC